MPSSKGSTWEYLSNGLVKHRATGTYYTRYQLAGKRTMKSLGTDDGRVAMMRHRDKLAKVERQRLSGARIDAGTGTMGDVINQAAESYEQDAGVAERSKIAFRASVARLQKQWMACFGASLAPMKPAKVTQEQVERFANFLHKEAEFRVHNTRSKRRGYGPATANTTLETLMRAMVLAKDRGYIVEIPFQLKGGLGKKSLLRREPQKKVDFSSQKKIQEVFSRIREVGGVPDVQPAFLEYLQRRANESADFAEFMAYSGARKQEAAAWRWEDEREGAIIIRGTKSESSRDREVPKIPAMIELLEKMKARRKADGRVLSGAVFLVSQCAQALTTACKAAGVPRWTHHTLRHLFATKCIESGVDIPTVSRWLGHADGGALAMKTYGHLRREHSQTQAAKVQFG